MIGFNDILENSSISANDVKLVRHKDNRIRGGRSPYGLWLQRDGRFDEYQALQGRPVFDKAKYIASFVVRPQDDTLFVGLFDVGRRAFAAPGLVCPLSGADVGGTHHHYDLKRNSILDDYAGRLVIGWGDGTRAWVQWARTKNKQIVEIQRNDFDPPFPGFMEFELEIETILNLPNSWQQTLRQVSGVYLLVCLKTGKHYVGSAYGSGGFWQRWEQYATTGHGGNEGMKLDPHFQYQVSILEVAGSRDTLDDVLSMEKRWKQRLQSKKFGLNKN